MSLASREPVSGGIAKTVKNSQISPMNGSCICKAVAGVSAALGLALLVPQPAFAGPWNGYSRDSQITILQQGLQDQASRNATTRMWDNILSVPAPAFPLTTSPYSQQNPRPVRPRSPRYPVPPIPPDIQIMTPEPESGRQGRSASRQRVR